MNTGRRGFFGALAALAASLLPGGAKAYRVTTDGKRRVTGYLGLPYDHKADVTVGFRLDPETGDYRRCRKADLRPGDVFTFLHAEGGLLRFCGRFRVDAAGRFIPA